MRRGEFELIADIRKRFSETFHPVLGIGDDAAVIDHKMLVTTDALVEDVHFLRDKIDFTNLGYKSIAVNLSDIAAMGGLPLYALITMGVTPELSDACVDDFLVGVESIATEYGVDLIGGDLVRSPTLFVSVTAIGQAVKEPFLRSGAKPGDFIYITGSVGDSAIGLGLETGGLEYPVEDEDYFRGRHYRPTPRVKLAEYLASDKKVHACIDISDGVLADLGHICEESGTGFFFEMDELPLSADRIGRSIHESGRYFYELAMGGGEDYELILTSPEQWDEAEFLEKTGVPVTPVGTITQETGARVVFHDEPVDPGKLTKGFRHI